MPTNHPYSRREFRRRMRDWLRRNLKLIALLSTGAAALIAIVTALVLATAPASPFTWWLLGALQVGLLAAYGHVLHLAFLAHDTDAIRHVQGAWGEDNTRSELHRAKRQRLVWGWIDSLDLLYGDIDHLVVTRRGGLVAIDSKWRNRISDTAEMARSAHMAQLRAEGLTRDLLKGDTRGTRRAKVNPLGVTAAVVVWGADQDAVPDGAMVDGVEFVAGRRLVAWLAGLDGQPVDRAAAAGILRGLDERRTSVKRAQAVRRGDSHTQ